MFKESMIGILDEHSNLYRLRLKSFDKESVIGILDEHSNLYRLRLKAFDVEAIRKAQKIVQQYTKYKQALKDCADYVNRYQQFTMPIKGIVASYERIISDLKTDAEQIGLELEQ